MNGSIARCGSDGKNTIGHFRYELAAQFAGVDPGHANLLAMAFIGFRILHGVFYIAAKAAIRSLVWMGGLYVAVRFAEAWGLWWDRAWGEWLGVISSGAYIPFEVHHVWLHRHWQGAVVLLLNVVLVCVLLIRLRQRQRQKTTGSGTESVLQSS